MSYKAKVAFDFDADDSEELSVTSGEIITVECQSQENPGWVQCVNQDGAKGLVPENYLEKIEDPSYGRYSVASLPDVPSDFQDSSRGIGRGPSTGLDEDFSDEEISHDFNDTSLSDMYQKTKTPINLEGHEIASDVDLQNLTAGWIPTDSNKYTVTIGPYKTDRKHYGTKKVVVYGVRPSYNNLMVYRRFNQFAWLQERLELKYGTVIMIPSLPPKEMVGNQEEGLMERRKRFFQNFANRMCEHPILSSCKLWLDFITLTDEKERKEAKRLAEKDEADGLVKLRVLRTIQTTITIPDDFQRAFMTEIEQFQVSLKEIKNCMRKLKHVGKNQIEKYKAGRETEFDEIAESMTALGQAIQQGPYMQVGMNFGHVKKLWSHQTLHEWTPFVEMMRSFQPITTKLEQLIGQFFAINEKNKKTQDFDTNLMKNYVIAISSEISFFKFIMKKDLGSAMHSYIEKQARFYSDLSENIKSVQEKCSR